MTSLKRKILFFIFLIIFIIATPAIILYAAGYKINFEDPLSGRVIQKTGMIILETEPEGADIYLNGKKQKNFLNKAFFKKNNSIKTPAKIKGLLPQKYEVKIELSGYWPVNKKLDVFSGQITYIEKIKLFKKNLPRLVVGASEQKTFISPDKKKIFLPKEGLIVDLKTENKTEAIKSENEKNILWSPDSKKILIENTILDLKLPKKNIYLDKLIGRNLKNVKWDKNSNKIYYQYKNSLNRFDLSTKINEILINEEELLDYRIKNDNLFIIFKNKLAVKLEIRSLSAKETIKEIELPVSDGYKLINPNSDLINLYDEKYKILYLINPFSSVGSLKEVINNIKYGEWINDKILLYANDFEIWTLNLEKAKMELLTRLSPQITGLTKTDDENYLIYFTPESINVLEKNSGETIRITELIKLDKILAPVLNENGDILYFYAKIGNQEGLYKLNI